MLSLEHRADLLGLVSAVGGASKLSGKKFLPQEQEYSVSSDNIRASPCSH